MHAQLQQLPPAPPPSNPGIERAVGELVADATAALLQGLAETVDGGLTRQTKAKGGDRIAELYSLKVFACGADFETVAKVQGTAVLKARMAKVTCTMPSDDQFAEWIGWTLGVLNAVVRARLH
jgi:hypothetical protein